MSVTLATPLNQLDLQDTQIREVENSLAFPTVSADQLQTWIQLREVDSDLAVVKAVRQFCQG